MNSAVAQNKFFQYCAFLEVTGDNYDRISAEKIICHSDEQRKNLPDEPNSYGGTRYFERGNCTLCVNMLQRLMGSCCTTSVVKYLWSNKRSVNPF